MHAVGSLAFKGSRNLDETAEVLQIVQDDPDFAVRLLGEKAMVPAQPKKAGSDLTLTFDDCEQFLREFCGIAGYAVDVHKVPAKPEGNFWPVPCAAVLTYERLAELIKKHSVPHRDWTLDQLRRVDAKLDCRKAEDGNYLLFTPAGVEATKACPQFVGVSYRNLWDNREVLTCREAVILWLFVWFSSKRKILLDIKGWTRTSSRGVGGLGVCVDSCVGRLNVCWSSPGSSDPLGSARSAVS